MPFPESKPSDNSMLNRLRYHRSSCGSPLTFIICKDSGFRRGAKEKQTGVLTDNDTSLSRGRIPGFHGALVHIYSCTSPLGFSVLRLLSRREADHAFALGVSPDRYRDSKGHITEADSGAGRLLNDNSIAATGTGLALDLPERIKIITEEISGIV
ncbi:hypothetical protein AcW1_007147 [Taiwanofungus camphoratus]|nr:hypothetical protein AcW1_007147 [Antrodia cinnamomea]